MGQRDFDKPHSPREHTIEDLLSLGRTCCAALADISALLRLVFIPRIRSGVIRLCRGPGDDRDCSARSHGSAGGEEAKERRGLAALSSLLLSIANRDCFPCRKSLRIISTIIIANFRSPTRGLECLLLIFCQVAVNAGQFHSLEAGTSIMICKMTFSAAISSGFV